MQFSLFCNWGRQFQCLSSLKCWRPGFRENISPEQTLFPIPPIHIRTLCYDFWGGPLHSKRSGSNVSDSNNIIIFLAESIRLVFCLQIIIDHMTKKIFDHNVVFEAVVSVLFTIIIGGMCGVGGGWGEVTVLGHWSSEEGAGGGGYFPPDHGFAKFLNLITN